MRIVHADSDKRRVTSSGLPVPPSCQSQDTKRRLVSKELLSRDFRYKLELLFNDPGIAFKDLIGKLLSFARPQRRLQTLHQRPRVLICLPQHRVGFARYRAFLLPWLACLRHRRDNYIFHEKKSLAQTEDIFEDDSGLKRWTLRLFGEDRVMINPVQFYESDHNYVSRLWHEHDWHYW